MTSRRTGADAAARSWRTCCGLRPIIPVITIERVEDAVPLARALVAGGVHAIEITLRTPAAPAAAAAIIKEVPEAIVGLGTVLTLQDLETARTLRPASR